jgi:hypothetical protein
MLTLALQIRRVGRRGALLRQSLELPLEAGQTITADALIGAVVRHEVAAFKRRQTDSVTLRALTEAEIRAGAARGAIKPPQDDARPQPLSPARAVRVAQQAFADGLFYLFIDDVQVETGAAALTLNAGSTLLFLRLVALAGG